MTIEQLALKAYPVRYGSIGDEKEWDMNEQYRNCWIEGYKEALSLSAVIVQREQFNFFLEDSEQAEKCESRCKACKEYEAIKDGLCDSCWGDVNA